MLRETPWPAMLRWIQSTAPRIDVDAWRSASCYDLTPGQVTADALALIASVGLTA